jgi:hypothetical protein
MPVGYTIKVVDEALEAAFEAGALKLCPKHQYNMIRTTSDPTVRLKAFDIGWAKIDRGQFSSERSQLMSAIGSMIDLGEDECHCCANTSSYQTQLATGCNPDKPCPCHDPTCPAFGRSHIPNRAE